MRYSTAVATFILGATAGSLATYFGAKKYFEAKADKEIADMKEFFRSKTKDDYHEEYDPEKHSVEEILDAFCKNTFGASFDIKFSEEEYDDPENEEVVDDAEEDIPEERTEAEQQEADLASREAPIEASGREKEEKREGRRVISPYEVSLVEFEDGSPAFDHTCLTYYMRDDEMLYDADGEKVDDIRRLIGQAGIDALNRQIQKKGGCFYICNKNFGQMYEVEVVDGTSGDADNYEAGFVNE